MEETTTQRILGKLVQIKIHHGQSAQHHGQKKRCVENVEICVNSRNTSILTFKRYNSTILAGNRVFVIPFDGK